MTPRLLASSAILATADINSGLGGRPASESFVAFTIIMYCIGSPCRLPELTLRPFFLLQLFTQLAMLIDSRAGSEVFRFKELANFDLPFLIFPMGIGRTLGPFNGFLFRLYVNDPITGD